MTLTQMRALVATTVALTASLWQAAHPAPTLAALYEQEPEWGHDALVTGFPEPIVPLLLLGYGAATVIGNIVVGRIAQSHTMPVIVAGLGLNIVFLVAFAIFTDVPAVAVLSMMGIGLVGITLNPAMVTRVQRAGGIGALVQTAHSSFITLGVVIGSWLGGIGIDLYGLRAPLWAGAGLAVLALLAVVSPIVVGGRGPFGMRSARRAPTSCSEQRSSATPPASVDESDRSFRGPSRGGGW